MPKYSGGIPLLIKEPIKLHHLLRDVLKQIDAYLNTWTKIAFGICRIFIALPPYRASVGEMLSIKAHRVNFEKHGNMETEEIDKTEGRLNFGEI
jgi:hypothetical protein